MGPSLFGIRRSLYKIMEDGGRVSVRNNMPKLSLLYQIVFYKINFYYEKFINC